MRKRTLLKFLVASTACALALGIVTLFVLRAFTESSTTEFRRHLLLSLTSILESGPLVGAIDRYEQSHPGSHLFRGKVWVLSYKGEVITSNTDAPLPTKWERIPKPEAPHEIRFIYPLLGLAPSATVIRLVSVSPTFLVLAPQREDRAHRRDFLQVLLFGAALAITALISMLMTFFYLRRKSKEASDVLLRLERGDLKARFQIKNFDEMGSLMLDFNRMAQEIEHLVGRLQDTEKTRRMIFQELSHDLRTPLTSLRASIDTLAAHGEEMTADQRKEIISVCQAEISYYMEILEALLFIAQMDEPRYKKATQAVNIGELLNAEVQIQKKGELASSSGIEWELKLQMPEAKATVPGDPQLIRRLIRNALENSGRYAQSKVGVTLLERGTDLVLQVQNDGPSITPEEIKQFGQPRNRRIIWGENGHHISLGLGSIIIKKIIDLHHGFLSIKSLEEGNQPDGRGTLLEIGLPRA